MNFEKDEIYGTVSRRPLAQTRRFADDPTVVRPAPPMNPDVSFAPPEEAHAFGPEAVERAQMMAYERTKIIQQESPVVRQEIVEHVIHDQRLYMGMWIVAGIGAVASYLTFSLACLIITVVAVGFALYCSPGREFRS